MCRHIICTLYIVTAKPFVKQYATFTTIVMPVVSFTIQRCLSSPFVIPCQNSTYVKASIEEFQEIPIHVKTEGIEAWGQLSV